MKTKRTQSTKKRPQMSLIEYLHKRVSIPNPHGGTLYIYLCNITHISIDDKKLYIHSLTDEPIYINILISKLYDTFPEPFFDNCHEAHIVNVNHVLGHTPGDGGILKVKDRCEFGYIEIPVSRNNKDSTKTAIDADTLNIAKIKDAYEKKTFAVKTKVQNKKNNKQ